MSAVEQETFFRFETVEDGLVALREHENVCALRHAGWREAYDKMCEAKQWEETMRRATDADGRTRVAIQHAIEQAVKREALARIRGEEEA
jgi:hypothetical protein